MVASETDDDETVFLCGGGQLCDAVMQRRPVGWRVSETNLKGLPGRRASLTADEEALQIPWCGVYEAVQVLLIDEI